MWGLGYTCISGAVDAWVTDEVGPAHVQPVFTRATRAGLAAGFGGTVLAGALGVVSLRLPCSRRAPASSAWPPGCR
ncbi:hypothetical protein GCM10025864_37860 [Luteimicrobium album]|uniref:Uncharacterized protein n=1 Tax=Luteimicrobium album TaxID=1054550 RepID=A0ABQ6I728_9MICO|nr:hypothetical protein GCM10025864_37860 [Luteimicrobium album]